MIRWALAGKWDGLGAKGSAESNACSVASRSAMIPGKSRDPPTNERIACRRVQPQFKESISRYLSLHKDKLIAAEQYSGIARPGLLLTQFNRNFDRFQLFLGLFQVSLA